MAVSELPYLYVFCDCRAVTGRSAAITECRIAQLLTIGSHKPGEADILDNFNGIKLVDFMRKVSSRLILCIHFLRSADTCDLSCATIWSI